MLCYKFDFCLDDLFIMEFIFDFVNKCIEEEDWFRFYVFYLIGVFVLFLGVLVLILFVFIKKG